MLTILPRDPLAVGQIETLTPLQVTAAVRRASANLIDLQRMWRFLPATLQEKVSAMSFLPARAEFKIPLAGDRAKAVADWLGNILRVARMGLSSVSLLQIIGQNWQFTTDTMRKGLQGVSNLPGRATFKEGRPPWPGMANFNTWLFNVKNAVLNRRAAGIIDQPAREAQNVILRRIGVSAPRIPTASEIVDTVNQAAQTTGTAIAQGGAGVAALVSGITEAHAQLLADVLDQTRDVVRTLPVANISQAVKDAYQNVQMRVDVTAQMIDDAIFKVTGIRGLVSESAFVKLIDGEINLRTGRGWLMLAGVPAPEVIRDNPELRQGAKIALTAALVSAGMEPASASFVANYAVDIYADEGRPPSVRAMVAGGMVEAIAAQSPVPLPPEAKEALRREILGLLAGAYENEGGLRSISVPIPMIRILPGRTAVGFEPETISRRLPEPQRYGERYMTYAELLAAAEAAGVRLSTNSISKDLNVGTLALMNFLPTIGIDADKPIRFDKSHFNGFYYIPLPSPESLALTARLRTLKAELIAQGVDSTEISTILRSEWRRQTELNRADAEAATLAGEGEITQATSDFTQALAADAPTEAEILAAQAEATGSAADVPPLAVAPAVVEPLAVVPAVVAPLAVAPAVVEPLAVVPAVIEPGPEVALAIEPDAPVQIIDMTPVVVEPAPTPIALAPTAARQVTVAPGDGPVTIEVTADEEVKKPFWKEPAVIAAGIAGTLGIVAVLLRARG